MMNSAVSAASVRVPNEIDRTPRHRDYIICFFSQFRNRIERLDSILLDRTNIIREKKEKEKRRKNSSEEVRLKVH